VIVKRFAPSSALVPFVRTFEIVEALEPTTRTLIPDTGLVMGFRYAGSATLLDPTGPRLLPNSVVTGLRTSVRRMQTAAGSGIVLAKFRAAGAASFFSEPLHHWFGLMCELGELINDHAEVACTSSRIAAATSDTERIAIFEQFLLSRQSLLTQQRQAPQAPDPIVSRALRAIDAAADSIRVRTIARELHVSQDTLEKRFRRVVGASPKQFATIVRLRRAIELSQQHNTLTKLALDAGYYDQSHFNRDFRAITGTAPGHFFENTAFCWTPDTVTRASIGPSSMSGSDAA